MNINTRDMNFVKFNGQDMDWVKFNGDLVWENFKELTAQGIPPITLQKCKNTNMLGYKAYGNSVQNGTPTPDVPIEIQSVGEQSKNLLNSALISGCRLFRNGVYNDYPGYVCNEKYIPVVAGETYTISAEGYTPTTDSGFVFFKNDTFVSALPTNSKTVTIPSGVNQLYYNFRDTNNPSSDPATIINPQFELGSSATTYEKAGYKIPITVTDSNNVTTTTNIYLDAPLRKLGNYSDYIDFEAQKVFRRISKNIFDGKNMKVANLITRYTDYTRFGTYQFSPRNLMSTQVEKCNLLRYSSSPNGFIVGGNSSASLYLYDSLINITADDDTNAKKIEKANVWLRSLDNTLAIWYVMNTETEESITLPDILLNKGTNIISVDTDITPSNMWIKYKGKGA